MTSSGIAEQPAMSVEATAAARDFLGGEKLEDGIGLCLSGGGFRAMLFHVGAFIRLNELGQLARLDRVASVSGGSIAAGALAVAWNDLRFDAGGIATNLKELVAVPLLDLARRRVDKPAILLGMLPFVSAARVASIIYDQTLFHGKTLQDLPDRPRFSFTATGLQSGVLCARDYAADWRVGLWAKPELPIAMAVGASAAFPPYLSPAYIDVPAGAIVAQRGADLCREPFTRRLCLTDGGIYDNLGLEPVWKRYKTILISDGGGHTACRRTTDILVVASGPRDRHCLAARHQHEKARPVRIGTKWRAADRILGHRRVGGFVRHRKSSWLRRLGNQAGR
jgi:NTE family protein